MRIPEEPDDLTTEWLTSALREGGRAGDLTVTSLEVLPLPADVGHTGTLVRLALGYSSDGPGAPTSLVAKFSSKEERMRRHAAPGYVQEVRFYRDLAARTSLPTPGCYYAAVDPESGYHVLLLEDFGASTASISGCTPEQAETAITGIAKFHAEWWESRALADIDWLPSTVHDSAEWAKRHEGWWSAFLKTAGHILPAAMVEIGERLGLNRARIMSDLFGASPRTLIHHDYHHNNMVFGAPGNPRPFAVLDWQGMSFGRGAWDVAYFMCQSLEIETRRSIETGLLQSYHRALVDGGVRDYSLERCTHDFRLALLQRFGSLISTIAAMPFTRAQIQRHIHVFLPRNIAAVLDHNAGELLK